VSTLLKSDLGEALIYSITAGVMLIIKKVHCFPCRYRHIAAAICRLLAAPPSLNNRKSIAWSLLRKLVFSIYSANKL
jgi:hypothetical protein